MSVAQASRVWKTRPHSHPLHRPRRRVLAVLNDVVPILSTNLDATEGRIPAVLNGVVPILSSNLAANEGRVLAVLNDVVG